MLFIPFYQSSIKLVPNPHRNCIEFLSEMVPKYAENLYEEVEPVAVVDARLSDGGREFLVKFPDAEEDSWVSPLVDISV